MRAGYHFSGVWATEAGSAYFLREDDGVRRMAVLAHWGFVALYNHTAMAYGFLLRVKTLDARQFP